MPNETPCLFLEGKSRCGATRAAGGIFCDAHRQSFAPLSNPDLLKRTAHAARASIFVNEEKKICPVPPLENFAPWAEYSNCMNELASRGYSEPQAMEAIGQMMESEGIWTALNKEVGLDPKWRKFEKLIAAIHTLRMEGAEVTFDDHIHGRRTSRRRQCDITIRFANAFYSFLLVIDGKDWNGPVPIDEVEAFCTKLEDVGADKGIMVSPHGFQEGAIKAAEACRIELFTLTTARTDWTSIVRETIRKCPFPSQITFDAPTIASDFKGHVDITMGDLLFYEDEHTPPTPLNELIGELCAKVDADRIPLPVNVEVEFEQPLLAQFPGTSYYTPVYGMKALLVPFELRLQKTIDMPPKITHYEYSDIAGERTYKLSADEVARVRVEEPPKK